MYKKLLPILSLSLILTLASSTLAHAATYYVNKDGSEDFVNIQSALSAVSGGGLHTIVVRDGIYTGAPNKNLDFGGKSITLRSENGPESCIIDCQGDGRGFQFLSGETLSSVVDGFTVENAASPTGGGFPDGWGGAFYCERSSPTIMNCIIQDGAATSGGGIACYSSASPDILNCVIVGNSATYGGAIYCNFSSSPEIINCTISANPWGAAIYCANDSWPIITNGILWGNSSIFYPEMILVDNASLTVSYSDVNGGQTNARVDPGCNLIWGAGNIDADPLFVGDGYHLSAGSPCIDAGTDAGVYSDIDDEGRPFDAGFDMGADEYAALELTIINLADPSDLSLLTSAPTFNWLVDGGTNNVFAVDVSRSPDFANYYSTYENLHHVIRNVQWTMPGLVWNRIPSGARVYWRVRGMNLDSATDPIITSDEVWSFTKQ